MPNGSTQKCAGIGCISAMDSRTSCVADVPRTPPARVLDGRGGEETATRAPMGCRPRGSRAPRGDRLPRRARRRALPAGDVSGRRARTRARSVARRRAREERATMASPATTDGCRFVQTSATAGKANSSPRRPSSNRRTAQRVRTRRARRTARGVPPPGSGTPGSRGPAGARPRRATAACDVRARRRIEEEDGGERGGDGGWQVGEPGHAGHRLPAIDREAAEPVGDGAAWNAGERIQERLSGREPARREVPAHRQVVEQVRIQDLQDRRAERGGPGEGGDQEGRVSRRGACILQRFDPERANRRRTAMKRGPVTRPPSMKSIYGASATTSRSGTSRRSRPRSGTREGTCRSRCRGPGGSWRRSACRR